MVRNTHDTATNTVVGAPIPIPVGGAAPHGVAVNPAGTRVYVANGDTNNVSVIDTATNTVVGAPIAVGGFPFGVAVNPAGTRVYVANFGSNNVSVIDTATNTVVGAPIAVGDGPVAFGQFIGPALPDLTLTKTHSGDFSQGQTGATYTVTVSNTGSADKTVGNQVSVTDTASSGLTITAMGGSGWTCAVPTCTRTDALAAGGSYPAITVTVSVAANATTPLTNSVAVSLSGQAESNPSNDVATDPTAIIVVVRPVPTLSQSRLIVLAFLLALLAWRRCAGRGTHR